MRIFTILAVLFICLTSPATAQTFEQWKQSFAQRASSQGISQPVIQTFLRDAQFLPKVIDLDRAQPERKKTFMEYYSTAVSESRIANGRNALRSNSRDLENAANRYGVPSSVITALWGMETSYGTYTGDWGVLSTLSTLAFEGRRAKFFSEELMAALRILQAGDVPASQLRGSWAGAMGQSQFMPTSYLRLAVDGNGDGKRDIWHTKADVFASAANYLSKSGWKRDLPWGTRAIMDRPLAPALVGLSEGRNLEAWRRLGVRPDGVFRVLPDTTLYLVQPGGANGPAYLVTSNFKTLKRWNNSDYFATSVGRLSDEIAQIPAGYSTPQVSPRPQATDNKPTRPSVYNQ